MLRWCRDEKALLACARHCLKQPSDVAGRNATRQDACAEGKLWEAMVERIKVGRARRVICTPP